MKIMIGSQLNIQTCAKLDVIGGNCKVKLLMRDTLIETDEKEEAKYSHLEASIK